MSRVEYICNGSKKKWALVFHEEYEITRKGTLGTIRHCIIKGNAEYNHHDISKWDRSPYFQTFVLIMVK